LVLQQRDGLKDGLNINENQMDANQGMQKEPTCAQVVEKKNKQ